MKIAYFINHYPKVSHSFIRREILALERLGFEVERIALRGWYGPLPDAEDLLERQRTRYLLQRGGWDLLLPAIGKLLSSPIRFCKALSLARRMAREYGRSLPYHVIYLAEACRVVSWTAAAGVRHIHAHFGTNSAEVVMLAQVLGGPDYSFTVHGPEEFLSPMGLEEKVHRARFVVAISSHGCSQIFFRTNFSDWHRVRQVHCGIEHSFYAQSDSAEATGNRLVCVGRLSKEKGQLLLIEAAAALVAKGVDFELILAGDGPLRAQLEALIRAKQLSGRVTITGWISSAEVRSQLLGARALVLPSFAEGLPVVIMEAMSLRRPVISTYIAGIPELVCNGESGWLIPAGSVEELSSAMQDCLSCSSAEIARRGAAAYERVIARHDIEVEARKLAALFAETAGTSPSQPH